MAIFVRATASGHWSGVDVLDIYGQRIGEKVLVMALETGRWCIDSRPVDVEPGLLVSFKEAEAAHYFISANRASLIAAEPDRVFAFESEADANFFVSAGLADRMSDREVQQMIAEAARAQSAEEDETVAEAEDDPAPKGGASKKRKGKG